MCSSENNHCKPINIYSFNVINVCVPVGKPSTVYK